MKDPRETYAEMIKVIVRHAMTDGVSWTDKEFAALKNEAIAEASRETARRLYGTPDA